MRARDQMKPFRKVLAARIKAQLKECLNLPRPKDMRRHMNAEIVDIFDAGTKPEGENGISARTEAHWKGKKFLLEQDGTSCLWSVKQGKKTLRKGLSDIEQARVWLENNV